ncbi:MAG: chemotaxis protein CheX [bacterium]
MAVKFFGQFMVEKGVVSREDLLKAVELQDSVNIKFGEMARSMGLLTDADIERIHEAQRSEDLRFGDMSIKLGILTEDQLKEVLAKQKSTHLYIGEALVKVGAVQADDLPGYLDAFKVDQAPYIIEKVAIPDGVPDPKVWEAAADLTYKMFTRIVNLTFKPGQCVVIKKMESNDTIVSMDLTGQVNAQYLLSVSSGVRKLIAKAILKEDDVTNETDEVLDDTVMEFMNIVCGNIAAKAVQLGKAIDILPPDVIDVQGKGVHIPEGGMGLLFPLYVADERVELGIFLKQA